MARIYEYQGKEILRKVGISVPEGREVSSASEARGVAAGIGKPVAIKAQVWATGRFKAGGIKFAVTSDEAEKAARELIGSRVKGLPVGKVLVEELLEIDREFYVGIIVNNSHKVKGPVLIFSSMGGIGIEEVAAAHPEKVATFNVDYLQGVGPSEAGQLISRLFDGPFPPDLSAELANVISRLY